VAWQPCFENGYISILKGTWKIRVCHVKDIPVTFEGKAVHNVANCLPSVMATYLFKSITIEDIRTGLQTFYFEQYYNAWSVKFFPFQAFYFLG
jgi:cyanophycin synthetase